MFEKQRLVRNGVFKVDPRLLTKCLDIEQPLRFAYGSKIQPRSDQKFCQFMVLIFTSLKKSESNLLVPILGGYFKFLLVYK